MLRLPGIDSGERRWRLPISDEAAVALADGLLGETSEQRLRRLASLVREEPTLAIWCVASSERDLFSVWAAAQWLADEAVRRRAWPDDAISCASTPEQRRRWADLAAQSVAACAGTSDIDGPEYLAALVRNASDWLAASRCDEGDDGRSTSVPERLTRLLARHAPVRRPEKLRLDADACRRLTALRERWLRDDGAAPFDLPALWRRLTRLASLESDFAAKLEREKLDALKELAYGASHEINNPLNNIATRAQTLLRDEKDPERRRKLATINAQAFRAHEMISDMMLFARPPRLHVEPINLSALLATVVEEMAPEAVEQSVGLRLHAADFGTDVEADAVQLAVAVKAVVRNSLEALGARGAGGAITIELRAAETAGDSLGPFDSTVAIVVTDDGPGISDDVRRHLFDPFYSGREAGRGLGFGLSKCWRIVESHGGRIDVASELGHGAVFSLYFPRSPRSTASLA